MAFDIFNQALTLIFAFPAAALLGPVISSKTGLETPAEKLAFSMISSILIYVGFILLHCYIHPLFVYAPEVTVLETLIVASICIVFLVKYWRNFFARHFKASFCIYCFAASVGISAVANLIYVNGRVFLVLPKGNFDQIEISMVESDFKNRLVARGNCLGDEYIVVLRSDLDKIQKLEAVGEIGEGVFELEKWLEPYSYGGSKGRLTRKSG